MAYLEIDRIYKTYAGDPLLSDVSLSVARGEIVSLLGPSGSGKTTLLRIVAGLERSESGRVMLDGEDVTTVPAHRRGIVLMFQEYALFPHMTVADNVGFGLRMRRQAPSQVSARVREMLDLVGLAGMEERNVVQLSGGERQRVALARSLAPHPRLLLLDEPLGSLDRNLRERLLEELAAILREVEVTAITVTHDQTEAFAVADSVALLHDTRVVQVGPPQAVYRRPANPWVARFLGLTNLLPATMVAQDRATTEMGTVLLDPSSCRDEGAALASGQRGTLLIPPWGLQLTQARSSEADRPNTFPAVVSRLVFQGRTTRLRVILGGSELTLSLATVGALPEVGEHVSVWVDPQAVCWFQS